MAEVRAWMQARRSIEGWCHRVTRREEKRSGNEGDGGEEGRQRGGNMKRSVSRKGGNRT